MSISKKILLISIFMTNAAFSYIDPIVGTKILMGVAIATQNFAGAVKDIKDMSSEVEADKNEQARYNREKRNIEKNLRECLEKNIGEELSELNVPKVCAEFVRKFINMYGIDEFSKKVCAYDAMCKADRALSKNQ